LTARTAVLPTEDPDAYQRHIQQFLDEYKPATPTETRLVHEIANTAWRLNRIPFLEAELLSQDPNPQSLIPQLATLGLHGSRLSRQFQKALEQPRDTREERRQLTEAAEIFLRHQHKGLSSEPAWEPSDDGFVFSKQQVERHARQLMRLPNFYDAHPRFQADPPPTGAAFSERYRTPSILLPAIPSLNHSAKVGTIRRLNWILIVWRIEDFWRWSRSCSPQLCRAA
jgi:hypothetical protein